MQTDYFHQSSSIKSLPGVYQVTYTNLLVFTFFKILTVNLSFTHLVFIVIGITDGRILDVYVTAVSFSSTVGYLPWYFIANVSMKMNPNKCLKITFVLGVFSTVCSLSCWISFSEIPSKSMLSMFSKYSTVLFSPAWTDVTLFLNDCGAGC